MLFQVLEIVCRHIILYDLMVVYGTKEAPAYRHSAQGIHICIVHKAWQNEARVEGNTVLVLRFIPALKKYNIDANSWF